MQSACTVRTGSPNDSSSARVAASASADSSFSTLRARGVAAINRALVHPAPVLVVAHGALFRATRAAMGLEPNIRTPNATPYLCEPGQPAWTLICFCLSVIAVKADEGYWLFTDPPTRAIADKYHFALTPEWLDHLRGAVVRIGGGTGSFVSSE